MLLFYVNLKEEVVGKKIKFDTFYLIIQNTPILECKDMLIISHKVYVLGFTVNVFVFGTISPI